MGGQGLTPSRAWGRQSAPAGPQAELEAALTCVCVGGSDTLGLAGAAASPKCFAGEAPQAGGAEDRLKSLLIDSH